MDFPHLNSESRTSSLSEISCSNLLDCDLSLNEENIKKLLHEQTPEQKRSSQNFISECAVSNDSNLSNCKEKKAIEVTVIIEDVSKDIDRKKQNRVNKLSTVLKLPDSIDYDRTEHLNSDNETIIENRTRDNLPDILKSPDANNCNNIQNFSDSGDDDNDSSESEESDIISLEGCIGTEQELSSDESENTENDTLDEEEALPSRQINKNDDDEWIDISESPVNFDEFVGENTYNIPSFVKSSEDVYKLFVTEEMINKMVSETNNYARNYLRTNQLNMKRKSRMKHWTDTNLQEMKTFLAVVMAMGLCKVPLINLYWSKNNLYRNEFISSAMTRDRFLLLLKCWHVSDVSNDDKTDKLYKIRDMLSMITDNFQNILNPGKYVVIDETMIPWRGRLGFRQYIKNKSHRYGVKLYKLCTPEGYTYQIEIYTGKTDQKKEVDHSQKVVLRLMNNIIEQGGIVIVDNFYTSVTLAEKLLSQKTFVCGTLNVRRKYLPKKVVNANIKKGQIIGKMNKKGVKVLKWNSINNDANKLPKRQFVEQLIEAFTKNDLDVDTEPTPNNPHHLEKRSKNRRCVGCYEKLRTFLSSREADKKAKKILTECIETALYLPNELKQKNCLVVCNRCKAHLSSKKNIAPSKSYWNNLDPGSIPEVIAVLSQAEQRLISRIIPFVKIIKLSGVFGQYSFRGQAVLFAQDIFEGTENLPKMLPRTTNNTGIIVVMERFENINVTRQFSISRQTVYDAFYWLVANNPLYKDVTIDQNVIINEEDIIRVEEAPVEIAVETNEESTNDASAYMEINDFSRIVFVRVINTRN
ncbi:unnamed protein product [Arctia plantaginis]|uniref:Transposase n=1 Tax=Arctia plantaginis TaxID=874455 RepID=A0A8S1AS82_ARCPL|nr:unnamed protein product [Arctia plantaginis]